MRRLSALAWAPPTLLLALLATACGALPPTGVQRAQMTAQDFNVDSRFGRTDLVLPRVDPAERDEYANHHRFWGTAVRVADIEMAGMKPKGDDDIDVFIKVAWYRMSEQDLKQTTLKQHWHSKTDAWLLTSEVRLDGDMGLLGEPVVVESPGGPRAAPQFPTIRLSGGDPGAAQTE